MIELPFAEDLNYWKTGQSSSSYWIAKAKQEIILAGGAIIAEAFGSDAVSGQSAFMLTFELQGSRFREVWPVLPTKSGKEILAARVQAATMLYRHIKAAAIDAKVRGARVAFFSALLLEDGRTVAEASLQLQEMGLVLPAPGEGVE